MSEAQPNALESSVKDLGSSMRLFLAELNFNPAEQCQLEETFGFGPSLELSKRRTYDDMPQQPTPTKAAKQTISQTSASSTTANIAQMGDSNLFSMLPSLTASELDSTVEQPSNVLAASVDARQANALAMAAADAMEESSPTTRRGTRARRRTRAAAAAANQSFSEVFEDELPPRQRATRVRKKSSAVPIFSAVPVATPTPPPTMTFAAQASLPSAAQIIAKAGTVVRRADDMLKSLANTLRDCTIPLGEDQYELAHNTESSLHHQLSTASANLGLMRKSILLQAADQHHLMVFRKKIEVQLHQLAIYSRELDYVRQYEMEPPPYVDLYVAEEPFPISVYHHKPMPGPLRVCLFKSARAKLRNVGKVTTDVIADMPQKSGKDTIKMLNCEKEMVDGESHDYEANFQQLIFKKGTRLHQASLKFKQQVKVVEVNGAETAMHLESNSTDAFIVTTHENQWAAAEGTLFESTVYANTMVVSWAELANAFQILYLRATRQAAERPVRPLALEDLAYVHAKLQNRPQIERSSWTEFWKWLEEGFRKIRFAKHLCDMWTNGLIGGFLNRADAEALLSEQVAGSFILRLSDTSSGLFVISFVTEEEGAKKMKHYLVTPEDTSTKKSLAEFLRYHPRLVYLLQVSVDDRTGKRVVSRQYKDTALKKFYGKTAPMEVPKHYDKQIE